MKLSEVKIPVLPLRNGFVAKPLKGDDFKGTGVGMTQYGVNVGDVIEMPDTEEDFVGNAIPVRKNDPNAPMQRIFLAKKNGEPAWVSMTVLSRRDAHLEPTDPVTKDCASAQDDFARLQIAMGKTIKVESMVDVEETVFEAGMPTDKTVLKQRPYCVWAE